MMETIVLHNKKVIIPIDGEPCRVMWIKRLNPSLPYYEISVNWLNTSAYRGYVVHLTNEGDFVPLFTTYKKYSGAEETRKLQQERDSGHVSHRQLAMVTYLLTLTKHSSQ